MQYELPCMHQGAKSPQLETKSIVCAKIDYAVSVVLVHIYVSVRRLSDDNKLSLFSPHSVGASDEGVST